MKIFALWLVLMTTSDLFAQEIPPFANVTSVEFQGTGCDAESARVSITDDLQYISILYDRFSAETGAGAGAGNGMRFFGRTSYSTCSVVVKFDLPAGWTMQFDQVEYHGFVALPNSKSVAQQIISVGSTFLGKFRDFQKNEIRGPMTDNFTTLYKIPVEATAPQFQDKKWAAIQRLRASVKNAKRMRKHDMFDCSDRLQNASIQIRSTILVSNLGDQNVAKIVIDSTDASFTQKLRINWNKCLVD